jgi:3(or 17)beta-hydroxysteroid dehydrogenase
LGCDARTAALRPKDGRRRVGRSNLLREETMDGARAGRLAGKVALITGAASGIGRATASLFHAEGAKVAATDRNEAGLKTLGPDADLTLVQDVTDEARWRAVVDEVLAAFGRLDILVNSAGVAVLGNIETTTLADWRKVNAVNAEGVFLGCRQAVRAMKETGGGSIVNLSSVAGIIGDASSLAYCAAKGAVRLMTKSAALHCARAGYKIRVNSVHPSFAETPMVLEGIARAKDPERIRAGLERAAPMGRMGTANEVANTILFLASDESSFTTGAEFMVDGGLTAQ